MQGVPGRGWCPAAKAELPGMCAAAHNGPAGRRLAVIVAMAGIADDEENTGVSKSRVHLAARVALFWALQAVLFAVALPTAFALSERIVIGSDFSDRWTEILTRPGLPLVAVYSSGVCVVLLGIHLYDNRTDASADLAA